MDHAKNVVAAEATGLRAAVFEGVAVPRHRHVARPPTAEATIAALVAKGKITTTTTMWHTVGAKAVSGWQVMQAEATIKAKEAKVRAT